jgi:preprotein translocase subunit YajC
MSELKKGDRVSTRHSGRRGKVIRICRRTAFVQFDDADRYGRKIMSIPQSNLIPEEV